MVEDPYDPTTWHNSHWVEAITTLANRWQARTDGYLMEFNTGMYYDAETKG